MTCHHLRTTSARAALLICCIFGPLSNFLVSHNGLVDCMFLRDRIVAPAPLADIDYNVFRVAPEELSQISTPSSASHRLNRVPSRSSRTPIFDRSDSIKDGPKPEPEKKLPEKNSKVWLFIF
ncbi:hypothetical protein H4Q26_004359 [Puccinia striiformis f. sp. tritici PST-130]|nr:hypothetical protein H4Q26_004359 [Puccinia striiformis f. sp. tritici PST-130]